jgi:hypothetical protein
MPGNLITSLLSLFASHLVLLTLAGFVAVGGYLAGWWTGGDFGLPSLGRPPAPAAESTVPSPAARPLGNGLATASQAETGPADAASKRPTQPAMIGGTLPNYTNAEGRMFRPGDGPDAGWARPDRDTLVQEARRAFWNGDFEGAERHYVDAISAYPDDPDLFGELGNLYQSMGQSGRSLDAYFEAARRLQASGQFEKLSEVMDLLESRGYPAAR